MSDWLKELETPKQPPLLVGTIALTPKAKDTLLCTFHEEEHISAPNPKVFFDKIPGLTHVVKSLYNLGFKEIFLAPQVRGRLSEEKEVMVDQLNIYINFPTLWNGKVKDVNDLQRVVDRISLFERFMSAEVRSWYVQKSHAELSWLSPVSTALLDTVPDVLFLPEAHGNRANWVCAAVMSDVNEYVVIPTHLWSKFEIMRGLSSLAARQPKYTTDPLHKHIKHYQAYIVKRTDLPDVLMIPVTPCHFNGVL